MNKLDGNKLIALSMGGKIYDNDSHIFFHNDNMGIFYKFKIDDEKSTQRLKYDSDWKHLMYVNNFIEELNIEDKFVCDIESNIERNLPIDYLTNHSAVRKYRCAIFVKGKYGIKKSFIKWSDSKIEANWMVVVAFFEWYNKNFK